MFEAIVDGAARVLTWEAILLIILGTWYGMIVGVLPGISGGVGLVLLIPATFGWPLDSALVLFAAAWGGSSYGGAITAILLGVPGEATNAVTVIDGFPLAKQGKAAYALGASALATAAGASVGIFVLVALLPVLRSIILLFGPAEFFAMALLGLAVIALVSAGSMAKGIFAGSMGLLLGVHGFNVVTGVSRFDFGNIILLDGIPLVPVFVGMFGIAQGVELLVNHDRVSEADQQALEVGTWRQMFQGMGAVVRHRWLFVRSSILGTVIGAVPGPGGTVATFLAYGHAMSTATDKSEFGKGDIRGVIAPEAANDAKDGGALIPTLAFGVPGTFAAALIMLALQFHGLRMGPRILGPELPTAFVIIFALFLSNWITSISGLAVAKWLVKVTVVPTAILGPAVIVVSMLGAYATRRLFADVLVCFLAGIVGYIFIRRKISSIPLVVAFLLAPMLETSFHQAYQIGDSSFDLFVQRPIAASLLVLVLVTAIAPPMLRRRRARRNQMASELEVMLESGTAGEDD
jgi:putative tricarboxylic transport membrane protein